MNLDLFIEAFAAALHADIRLEVERALLTEDPQTILDRLAPPEPPDIKFFQRSKYDNTVGRIRVWLKHEGPQTTDELRSALAIDAKEWEGVAGHGRKSPINRIAGHRQIGGDMCWNLLELS